MDDPAAALTEPVARTQFPDSVGLKILDSSGYFDLGEWVLKALDWMTGVNIAVEITDYFAGDWEAVGEAADALRHLGVFSRACGAGVLTGFSQLAGSWQGNAETAAQQYFAQLGHLLLEQESDFATAARGFDEVATELQALADLVEAALTTLIDYGIAAVTAGLGGAVGLPSLLRKIIQLVEKGAGVGKDLGAIMDDGARVVNIVAVVVPPLLAAEDRLRTVRLPGSYDNKVLA